MTAPDEIVWINHAGYELRSGALRLVTDPWMEGAAFANGWSLLSPTQYPYQNFKDVNFIWFSHEHPDHFAPPCLSKIPPEYRSKITVLFQTSPDRRVTRFCEKLGFQVKEYRDWERVELSPGAAITIATIGHDSWSFVETENATYLNFNDCISPGREALAAIRDRLNRPIDVLLTQFSYAMWAGNPGQLDVMRVKAEQKIKEMEAQIEVFAPRVLIPFASYVWFSHPENFHLNAGVNHIDAVYSRFKNRIQQCVVLYPGETFTIGADHDSDASVARYMRDVHSHSGPLAAPEQSVPLKQLLELAEKRQASLRTHNTMWALAPLKWIDYMPKVRIYLKDIGAGISYSMFDGISSSGVNREDCDMEFSSSLFAMMLKFGYGYDTLLTSGRFLEKTPGAHALLGKSFRVPHDNELGLSYPAALLGGDIRHRLKALLVR